jgi:4,5-dihydroxyphthalate decarboxylase
MGDLKSISPLSNPSRIATQSLWEEEHAAGGSDPYVWGFKKSRAEVDKMLEYAQQQGLIKRRFRPEEMFHSSTLET